MSRIDSVTLETFRCFREKQTVRLAPLTLLVGENSTGKTSFLALLRAMAELAFVGGTPNFKTPPYDLGSFDEIAHHRGAGAGAQFRFQRGSQHASRSMARDAGLPLTRLSQSRLPAHSNDNAMGLRRCRYGNVFPQAMHGPMKSKVQRLACTSHTSVLNAAMGSYAAARFPRCLSHRYIRVPLGRVRRRFGEAHAPPPPPPSCRA